MKRSVLEYLVYTDLFISFAAMSMAWESGFMIGIAIHSSLLRLIFFATLTSYTFHSLINLVYTANSDRQIWNNSNKSLLTVIFVLALLLLLYHAFPFLKNPLPLMMGGLLTFLYSAPNLPGKISHWLKKIAFGKTVYLALIWSYATTLLPILLTDNLINLQTYFFFAYRFFLIYAICILFDNRDVKEDKLKGIKALPTLLNEANVKLLYFLSLLASFTFSLLLKKFHPLLLIPILILIPIYVPAQKKRSDWFYYVQIDGLMAITAILHAIIWLTS